jgi:hypothetical protein
LLNEVVHYAVIAHPGSARKKSRQPTWHLR